VPTNGEVMNVSLAVGAARARARVARRRRDRVGLGLGLVDDLAGGPRREVAASQQHALVAVLDLELVEFELSKDLGELADVPQVRQALIVPWIGHVAHLRRPPRWRSARR
jgi:hypothetical protein